MNSVAGSQQLVNFHQVQAGSRDLMTGTHAQSHLRFFAEVNLGYVRRKVGSNSLDPHWQPMLNELLEEHALGRVEGPFQAPPSWGIQATTCGSLPLLDLADQDIRAAECSQFKNQTQSEDAKTGDGQGITALSPCLTQQSTIQLTITWLLLLSFLKSLDSVSFGDMIWQQHIDSCRCGALPNATLFSASLRGLHFSP
jgi:hypothetical protein